MCVAKRRIWSIILPRRKLSILSKNLKALVRFTKIDFFFNCFRVFWERTRRQSCRKDERYRMACAVNGQRQMVMLLTIALVWFLIISGCHVEILSSFSEENFFVLMHSSIGPNLRCILSFHELELGPWGIEDLTSHLEMLLCD